MNVLIVEDEPTTRALPRRVLTQDFSGSVAEVLRADEHVALSILDDSPLRVGLISATEEVGGMVPPLDVSLAAVDATAGSEAGVAVLP